MPATLSVAMIARNEEKNLPRTLEAVKWADEIVIVDSGSVDRTPEIAASFGAKHSFNRDFRGHPEQKIAPWELPHASDLLVLHAAWP